MLDIWIMAPSPARTTWLLRAVTGDRSIRVAGTALSFPFLRSLMSESEADLALIDLESQADTAATRDWLNELLDLVPIVLLSPESDTRILNRMLTASSGGMLRTDASAEQIVRTIKSVATGLMVFDRSFARPREDDPPAE